MPHTSSISAAAPRPTMGARISSFMGFGRGAATPSALSPAAPFKKSAAVEQGDSDEKRNWAQKGKDLVNKWIAEGRIRRKQVQSKQSARTALDTQVHGETSEKAALANLDSARRPAQTPSPNQAKLPTYAEAVTSDTNSSARGLPASGVTPSLATKTSATPTKPAADGTPPDKKPDSPEPTDTKPAELNQDDGKTEKGGKASKGDVAVQGASALAGLGMTAVTIASTITQTTSTAATTAATAANTVEQNKLTTEQLDATLASKTNEYGINLISMAANEASSLKGLN